MDTLTIEKDVLEITKNKALNSILQDHAHDDTSKKYVYLSTKDIVKHLESLGWKPVNANQKKSRKFKGFQKHLIKLEHKNFMFKEEKINLLLINSHDGKSSLQFKLGVFRFACSNGMVVGETFETIRLRHMNLTYLDINNSIKKLMDSIPNLINNLEDLKKTMLSTEQIMDMAKKALMLRFNDTYNDITFDDLKLIKPLRSEDSSNSAWNIFNRLQEKIIKGKFDYVNQHGKNRKLREIKGIDKNVSLNSKLFDLALSYTNNN